MYYILDCENEEYLTASRGELYRFVKDNLTTFGNFDKQKRVLIEKVKLHNWSIYQHIFRDVYIDKNWGLRVVKYIVYDSFMNLVDYKVLERWVTDYKYKPKQLRYEIIGTHDFRRSPVERTGGWGRCRYSRRVKTTQELRANQDPDYQEYIKPKRKKLPNSWDDVKRSDMYIAKSWKKNKKKKQWM